MQQVTAAILIKNSKILIAKRSASDKLPNKWEFPGGKIENGETPEKCLQRELYEEFGITTTVKDYFGKSIYKYKHGRIELLAYFVKWISGDLVPTAHEEIRWVAPKELQKFDFAPADIPFVNQLMEMRDLE